MPRRTALTAVLAVLGVRLVGVLVLVVAADASGRSAHARLTRWDAQWYAGVARHGYGLVKVTPDGRHLADYAFFPLYPALERGVGALTGLRYVDAGLLVSVVATAAAAWGCYAVGERVAGPRAGLLLALLWSVLPVSVVTSMAYSEAVFTAVAAWAVHAVLRERWLLAGTLALLAGATRPTGVAVVLAVGVPAALALRRRRSRALPGLLLAPLGLVGYVGWVSVREGSYFRVASGWGNDLDGGRAFAGWVGDHLTGPTPWQGVLLVLGVVVLLGLLALGVRDRQPLPLLLFSGATVALAFATSGYFGSKPRYLLPAFGLLLPLAVRLARVRPATGAAVVGLLAVVSWWYGAVWLLGPGPP